MPRDPALSALGAPCRSSPRRRGPSVSVRGSVGEAQHHGVAQEPVRLTVGGDDDANEIVRSPPSATDGAHDALTLLGAQPERGFAGVADVAVVVLATEQERHGTAAVARATSEHDDPLLAAVLVLDPRRAAAPTEIGSDETLEHDALDAMRPRHRGELGRLIDEVLRNKPPAAVEAEFVQKGAAGAVRQAPRRASADVQDVEDHEGGLLLGAMASNDRVHARAYRGEVGAAVGVEADDLRIEQRGLSPEPPASLRDELRERGAQVVAVSGAERRATAVVPELPAQPVPLDL